MIYHFFANNRNQEEGYKLKRIAFVHSKTSSLDDDHLQDDCSLFYQILLEKNNSNGEDEADKIVRNIYKEAMDKDGVIEDLSHTLIYVNFGETLDNIKRTNNTYYKNIIEKMLDPVNGGFSIEFENGETVKFVSFFKSNSMSKKKALSFVDKKYRDNLIRRNLLDLKIKEKGLSLSRYYAYTGLSMSGGIRLDINKEFKDLGRLELNEKRVIVVKDYQKDKSKTFVRPFITMATRQKLIEVIENTLFIKTFLLLNDGHELNQEEATINFSELFRKKCKEIRGWISPKIRSKEKYQLYQDFYSNCQLEDIRSMLSAFGVNTLPDSLPLNKENLDKVITNYISNNYLSIFAVVTGGNDNLGNHINELISLLSGETKIEGTQVKDVLILYSINQSSDQFDGEGLISPQYSEIINRLYTDSRQLEEGKKHTSFQVRMPLVKGILHTVDFKSFYEEECMQKYFVDIKNENVQCLNGLYYEKTSEKKGVNILLQAIIIDGEKYILDDLSKKYRRLKDIEIILTTGQVKNGKITTKTDAYNEDFMKAYFDAFNKYHHSLYITGSDSIEHKVEEETELNYQFLSTAGLGREEAEIITKKQKERIEKLYKGDYETIKNLFELDKGDEIVGLNIVEMLNELISEEDEDNELNSQIFEGRKYPALKYNENLKYTNAVRTEINDLILKQIKEISIGHIKLRGELRYLSGDLLVFLYTAVGGKDEDLDPKEELLKYSFYAPKGRFYQDDNSPMECVLLRNPHISKNENTVAKPWIPYKGSLREKYFNNLDFVCMINGESLIQERLGGADYDGDEVRIISDTSFVEAVKKDKKSERVNFEERKHLGITPIQYETAIVPSIDSKNGDGESVNDGKAIYISLSNTFGNKVGLYSNDGFKAACVAYSDEHIGDFKHELKVVEYYLTVGLEVDSAKSGTKPQSPKQLIKSSDPIFSSAERFLFIKDALTSDAEEGSKKINNHLSHDSNAVLVLDEIGANLLNSNKLYEKDKSKLESVMPFPEEKKDITDKIKGFVSYYNFMTSSFTRKSRYNNQTFTDLLMQIIKQNFYPSDAGEIMQEIYDFVADYDYRLDGKPNFAKIALLTNREACEEIKAIYKLDEKEALECLSPIETLSRHENNMSKVFNLVYFLYNTTKKLEEESGKDNKKEKEIDDEDVKSFAFELNDTIASKYKRGVYTRRENKDSILKLGVLKKHISKLFNSDDYEALRYIFMLDSKYASKIPSWVLWDLYGKELSEVVQRRK